MAKKPVDKSATRAAINSAALACAQVLNKVIGMTDEQIDWSIADQDAADLEACAHNILASIEESGEPEPKTSVEPEPQPVERESTPEPYDPYWRQERDFNQDYDNGR